MKTLAAAVLVTTFAASAHAQALDLTPQPATDIQQLEHGHHRKVKGEVLTGLAIANLAVGMGLGIPVAIDRQHGNDGGLDLVRGGMAAGSALTTIAGIGLAAPGIPLWVMGAREEQRARTSLSASAGGLVLQF